VGWRYPVRLVRADASAAEDMDFSFYGPTCDDMDHMKGPFRLPADIQAGDYIEVGQLGAYGCAMRTGFNGFGAGDTVVVEDAPMASLIPADGRPRVPANVVPMPIRVAAQR
jgi:ornithine decarboxylase